MGLASRHYAHLQYVQHSDLFVVYMAKLGGDARIALQQPLRLVGEVSRVFLVEPMAGTLETVLASASHPRRLLRRRRK